MRPFLRSFLGNFLAKREEGNIAILAGIMLVPMLGVVGLAVDSARAFTVQHQLQQALDAAALAGGRFYGFADRDTRVQNYFNANWITRTYGATPAPLVITEDNTTHTLRVAASASVAPIFVKFIGISTVTVGASAESTQSDTTMEVALVMDTTGSMNSNDDLGNHKMTSAINSATLLLDILFAGEATNDKLFVGLVPFVQNVNVGSNYSSWLVAGSEAAVPWNSGPYPTSSGWRGCMFERLTAGGSMIFDTTDTPPTTQRFRPYHDSYLGPTCTNWASGQVVAAGDCRLSNNRIYSANAAGTTGSTAPSGTGTSINDGGVQWTYYYRFWRTGENIGSTGTNNMRTSLDWFFTYEPRSTGTTSGTTPPRNTSGTTSSGGISWRYNTRLTSQDPYFSDQYGYGYNSGCGSPVVPLTNTRATVQNQVNLLAPSTSYGGTMTNTGLLWGWRMVSPNYRGLWAGVPSDRPLDNGSDDNYKAVIILTDGDNVFQQCTGTFCKGSSTPFGYLSDGRLGTTNSAAAVTAVNGKVTEICNNMRAAGVLIYAVMFDLPAGASTTKTLFQNCVGDPTRFFDAADSAALQTAFEKIALELTKLRLAR